MSTLSVRLPDSYHTMVKKLASKDNVSINQFVISAVAEKISAMETEHYLEERAAKGSRDTFLSVLGKVPDTVPDECDR